MEKGTCFALWRDSIDGLSQYHSQSEAFHVMRLSRDHAAKVGLSFDCPGAAAEFLGCLERLGDDPENVALGGPHRGKKATGKAR